MQLEDLKMNSENSISLSRSQQNSPTACSNGALLSRPRTRLKRFLILALFIIGLIVCVISLLSILLLPTFVTNQISKRLVLKNNSLLLERWSKPNVPMYFKVWVFDVKNAQEVLTNKGTKPQLQEIGPFVFHLKRQKDIISFAGDNLYYTERKVYHFSPELSCCTINTTVTIPNIPLVAVVDRALSYNLPLIGRFIPRLINRAIQSLREQLFVKKQVREILFDGYEVELLKMVSRVGSIVGLPQTNQRFAILKGRNDTWRPEQDGVWAINTGARDRRLFGKVSSWNSYKQLPFWAAPTCNTINGSDGTLFPPPIKKTEPLYIFNQELCRTVNLVYDRPSDIRAIQAYRFVLNPMNFAHTMSSLKVASSKPLVLMQPVTQPITTTVINNDQQMKPVSSQLDNLKAQASEASLQNDVASSRSRTPDQSLTSGGRWRSRQVSGREQQVNTRAQQERLILAAQEAQAQQERKLPINPFTCFCDRKSTNLNGKNVCEFDGLIDLSKCTKQAQVIFGSMPHFYNSDPSLLNQVVGMEPNGSKHTTYLDIEPNTGLVLGGKRRVQLNLLIKHNNEVEGFENINDMLVPVVWFEESALIPEESAKKFRSLYTDRIRLVNIVLTTLFLAALALLAIDLRLIAIQYALCFKFNLQKQQQQGESNKMDTNSSSLSNSLSGLKGVKKGNLLTSHLNNKNHDKNGNKEKLESRFYPSSSSSSNSLGRPNGGLSLFSSCREKGANLISLLKVNDTNKTKSNDRNARLETNGNRYSKDITGKLDSESTEALEPYGNFIEESNSQKSTNQTAKVSSIIEVKGKNSGRLVEQQQFASFTQETEMQQEKFVNKTKRKKDKQTRELLPQKSTLTSSGTNLKTPSRQL